MAACDVAWLDGRFLPLAEARISPLDRGFLFGDAVYEGIPVYDGKVYRLEEHLDRLERSLRGIRIDAPLPRTAWYSLFGGLIVRNGGGDLLVYLQVTRGVEPERMHVPAPGLRPTIFAMASRLAPLPADPMQRSTDAVTAEDWQRILGVNLIGAFQMARAVKAPMDAAGAGVIVNVSSVAGIAGVGSSIPYCASKAALNNLTVTLARSLAPKIRVVAVAPGFITGRWLSGGLGGAYEPVKKAMEAKSPLGRVCDPTDVADAIVSLICGSDLVTGVVLPVESGMLISA